MTDIATQTMLPDSDKMVTSLLCESGNWARLQSSVQMRPLMLATREIRAGHQDLLYPDLVKYAREACPSATAAALPIESRIAQALEASAIDRLHIAQIGPVMHQAAVTCSGSSEKTSIQGNEQEVVAQAMALCAKPKGQTSHDR